MKKIMLPLALSLVIAAGTSSCTTTYDAAGRPVQSVDPGTAAVGAAAAGAAGYAIGRNSSRDNRHYYSGYSRAQPRPYYRAHPRGRW